MLISLGQISYGFKTLTSSEVIKTKQQDEKNNFLGNIEANAESKCWEMVEMAPQVSHTK
jgi:hypothetical protein